MAKITRFSGNLVAPASAALGTERTLFGEVTQSDDLTDQFTADLLRGWGIVGPSDQPTLQDFNAMGFTLGQIHAYLHQVGVPEWDAAQEFHTDSFTNRNGVLYVSLVDTNVGNDPESSPAQWRESGALLDSTRIDVVSATTVDITTAAPNTRHINITGTTTINGFTAVAGVTYFVRFNAALTLTNSASLVTQTGANIQTSAGDTCIIRATANNVVEVLCYTHAEQGAFSFGATSYKKTPKWLDGGTIEAWGSGTTSATGRIVVTIPLAMADTDFTVLLTAKSPNTGFSGQPQEVNSTSRTPSTFEVGTFTSTASAAPNSAFNWRVVGKAP